MVLDSAWIYDAGAKKFIEVGPMINGHDDFAGALLPMKEGKLRVLLIAGYGPGDVFQSNCEIFEIRPEVLGVE